MTQTHHLIAHEAEYRSWMIGALAGDAVAYRQLLTALTPHLKRYFSRRLDAAAAEDAAQETLMAIHSRRATYDPAQPFTAWVHGIARYKLVDAYRRHRKGAVPLDDALALFDPAQAEAAAARRDVERLLDKLPEARRALLTAVKLDGETISDIAARLGWSESAVKVGVHRALQLLKDEVAAIHG